ncbi:IS110 family transposase [Actinomycetospora sp. NBRC 106375]|uniref:IS110 family transposase n=1 Tax=Actinomycetospora sp. NBRC 106375 TaxID=3032207 RepID=UPI0024A38120|nr:IS110 family transposase [Actinomycetospora sp. NBRC 106375]GLZ50378.1 IS110 family transposase [Actinomycetospora sp. NBRC 106375]
MSAEVAGAGLAHLVGLIRSLSACGRDSSQMCRSVTSSQAGADLTAVPGREHRPMPMLAETVDAVVGVDTHRDTHELEIAHPTGAVIATCTVPNTSDGFARALGWITQHAPGPRVVAAVEGTRSYGSALARALGGAGLVVLEAEQPTASERRGRGKTDAIDAHLAVLWALRLDPARLPTPRADGDREALRTLLCAREEITTAATGQINRLKALLRDGDDRDRALARGKFTDADLNTLARRRQPVGATRAQAVRHGEVRRLTVALREARRELKANHAALQGIVDELAPRLTDQPGIGPVSAAQAIVSFSHPGRCRSEAAFAALAGASPLEASSGPTTRHRLNRGGDRALNRALHIIAMIRMSRCPTTQAYVERRRAQGKSAREIRRCLKRYIARQLHRQLTAAMATPA